MRPPDFWFTPPNRPSWQARLLSPLAAFAAWITARRVARSGYTATVPVICVGNLNLGGSGKTPTVIALLEHFAAKGLAAHVVSRGYGGSLQGPIQVRERVHKSDEVGDEPLLLAAFAPVWVAKDRAAGVKAAEAAGAQIVVLDDGFQNPSVVKQTSIVVVDAVGGFGNGRVVPAGPLREPVPAGLSRATAILLIGAQPDRERFLDVWAQELTQEVLQAELVPLPTGLDWAGQRILAFAGIGRPEKFFATLRGLGVELVRTVSLADHQDLRSALLVRLEGEALARGAQLVTTEKDAVRLPKAFRAKVLTLPVRLSLAGESSWDQVL